MARAIPPLDQVAFGSSSDTSRPKPSNESPLLGIESNGFSQTPEPGRYTLKDMMLLLAILCLPMVIVSLVLLVFLFIHDPLRIRFQDNGTNELPINLTRVSNDSYYTRISPGKVSLISGWASQAALFVMPYFMILFSFWVGREVAFKRPAAETINNTRELHDLLHGLLKGAWKDIWAWVKFVCQGKRSHRVDDVRALHLAAVGMMISLLFYVLLFGAENWLHITISSPNLRYYCDIQLGNASDPLSWSSFAPIPDLCSETLSSASLDPFTPLDFIPCSLNNDAGIYDLAHPEVPYTMLEIGISPVNDSFYQQNWGMVLNEVETYQAAYNYTYGGAANQVVTHFDPDTNRTHAFLFYQFGGYEINYHDITHYGLDFVAETTSMSTECTPISQACQLFNSTDTTTHNLSIPYNCSSMFSGDLNIAPYDGLEQFRGWDTSFYEIYNSSPRNISVASQLNPFHFNATAAVFSTTFQDIAATEDHDIWNGAIVNAGNSRVAFALSCNATIYDVQYAMINGSITSFNATRSDPRKASIIKGPLQVGFGRHNLFNAANLALLNFNALIADAMAVAFSQVGIALASGAFNQTLNLEERYRYDQVFTQVPKAVFWFLVVVCLAYAALGLVIFIAAICLRRTEGYARAQGELLPREKIELTQLAKGTFGHVRELVSWGDAARELYER